MERKEVPVEKYWSVSFVPCDIERASMDNTKHFDTKEEAFNFVKETYSLEITDFSPLSLCDHIYIHGKPMETDTILVGEEQITCLCSVTE